MFNQKQKKILILALFAGEIMMKSGAEIYRVEDTVSRICKACGIPYVEVFATTTGIFVSLDDGTEYSDMHTFIKRIRTTAIDLEKISGINQFSREFTTTDLSVEEGMVRLKEIQKGRQFNFPLRVLGSVLIASFFTAMLGGSPLDFAAAAIVGFVVYFATVLFDRLALNLFIKDFLSCALVAFLALVLVQFGLGEHSGLVIIGSIMMFLPGVSMTNAVRDSLAGDLLSGLARFMEAILVAISIACGVGFVLQIWSSVGGVIQ